MADHCHTSTPFVHPDSVESKKNSIELDGSIFDQSSVLSNKERSGLEMSSIPSNMTPDDISSTGRIRDISQSESIISDETVSSCTLDKGFIQSSLNDTENTNLLEDSTGKHISGIQSCNDSSIVTADKCSPDTTTQDGQACLIPADKKCIDERNFNDSNIVSTTDDSSFTAQTTCTGMSTESEHNTLSTVVTTTTSTTTITKDRKTAESSSVYLDDGCGSVSKNSCVDESRKRKRMTLVERRTLEALKSFGGEGLGSVLKKAESFADKLQKDKETREIASEEPKLKKTRLAAARAEANELFKDIPLGKPPEGDVNSTAKPSKDSSAEAIPERRLTRLERAKIEAMQSFGGSSFNDIFKPPPTEGENSDNDITADTENNEENKENLVATAAE